MNGEQDSILEIHLDRLEMDGAEQPKLTFEWSSALAGARRATKKVKNALKLKYAELSLSIRQDPQEFGFEKVTEGTIDSLVLVQKDYQELQGELVQAEFEEDNIGAMVEALRDRRAQIGHEVQLYNGMYWSKPDTEGKHQKAPRSEMAGKARKK